MRFKKELESFKKLGFLNPNNCAVEDGNKLPIKYGVRVVVQTRAGEIILINVTEKNYHSLVGGQVEEAEKLEEAVVRESKEESGYNVSILKPLGYTEIWNKKHKKFDFGFLANAVGEQQKLELTKEEVEDGHEINEYSIERAIEILENDVKNSGNSISERSLIFLKEAQNVLK